LDVQWKILLTGGRGYAFPGNCGGNLLLLGLLYDLQIKKWQGEQRLKLETLAKVQGLSV
jgi:hypothetical protein